MPPPLKLMIKIEKKMANDNHLSSVTCYNVTMKNHDYYREEGLCGIPVPDYTDENVSSKVVGIVQSYVGIVDRFVWRKVK